MKNWLSIPTRRPLAGGATRRGLRARTPGVESLEDRMVLSTLTTTPTTPPLPPPPPPPPGGPILGGLSFLGVIPGPPGGPGGPGGGSQGGGSNTKLVQDMKKLQTDVGAVQSKSGVTVADLSSLNADSQAIGKAGAKLDPKAVQAALSDIANAIAGNTFGAKASALQTEFNTLFAGSKVSATVQSQAFNDVVKTITDSHISTSDLATIAADQAAIKADSPPPPPPPAGTTGGPGGGSGGTTTGTHASTSTSSTH